MQTENLGAKKFSLRFPASFAFNIKSQDEEKIVIAAKIPDKNNLKLWFEAYRVSSGTGWILDRKIPDGSRKYVLSERYLCQHSRRNKCKSTFCK